MSPQIGYWSHFPNAENRRNRSLGIIWLARTVKRTFTGQCRKISRVQKLLSFVSKNVHTSQDTDIRTVYCELLLSASNYINFFRTFTYIVSLTYPLYLWQYLITSGRLYAQTICYKNPAILFYGPPSQRFYFHRSCSLIFMKYDVESNS